MMMLGMHAQPNAQLPVLNQVLLAAANINNGALLPASNSPLYTGQGVPIAALSNQVTVYYSSHDDVLPWSKDFLKIFHNPSYHDRLGLEGPSSYANLLPRTCGVDCSAVISKTVIGQIPQVPPVTTAHSSYFHIPQVLRTGRRPCRGPLRATAPARRYPRGPAQRYAAAGDDSGSIGVTTPSAASMTSPASRHRSSRKRGARICTPGRKRP